MLFVKRQYLADSSVGQLHLTNQSDPWRTVILYKLMVTPVTKKCPPFMESKDFMPFCQQIATMLQPELAEPCPQPHTLFL